MANVNIQLGYKDSAWFAANATLVLLAGQIVYLQQTGTYKIGDGTTQLQNLAFKGVSAQTDLVVATVVNKTGVNLLASNYQAVKVSTAQGQRLAVDLAQANNDNNSADTIGLVNQNININQEGTITILGQITEINTTGSLQGETWVDGDVLYLSPTTAGAITKVKPTGATGHIVVLGYVEYAHAIHGKIYTKIMNGWELEELHNVYDTSYTTPIDADSLLIKDSTASLWKRLTWANLKTLIFTIPSLVSQAAGIAITGVQWVLGSKQWIGGNITTQKEIELTSPSYSFTTSSTITNAYSMYVNAPTASTNATITNNYAIGATGNVYVSNGILVGSTNSALTGTGQVYANNGFFTNANSSLVGIIGYTNNVSIYSKFSTGSVFIGVNASTDILKIDTNGLTITDAKNIILNTTTGTKIGTATSQKLSFWNATPIVQPTTAIASSTIVNGTGTASKQDDTFDGYTMAQIVKALRNTGILQ